MFYTLKIIIEFDTSWGHIWSLYDIRENIIFLKHFKCGENNISYITNNIDLKNNNL